jgi:hypothetical protein
MFPALFAFLNITNHVSPFRFQLIWTPSIDFYLMWDIFSLVRWLEGKAEHMNPIGMLHYSIILSLWWRWQAAANQHFLKRIEQLVLVFLEYCIVGQVAT